MENLFLIYFVLIDIFYYLFKMQNNSQPLLNNWPEIRRAAEYFQSLGLSVVPVNREKQPMYKFKTLTPENCLSVLASFSLDLDTFTQLSAKSPPLSDLEAKELAQLSQKLSKHYGLTGIGIRTGDPLFVVDLDLDHNLGDGREHWAALLNEWGINEPLQTWQVQTGSGGRHLYFRWEARFSALAQSAKIGGKAIDIRSSGGFVVAPPSPWFDKKEGFAFTGRYYSWLPGCRPDDLPLGTLPEQAYQWLLLNTPASGPKVPKALPNKTKGKKTTARPQILPERAASSGGGEEEDDDPRDVSPKRVHLPKHANEIAQLILPLVQQNDGVELNFAFYKYKDKTVLIFTRKGPDPVVCSLCRPIREAKGVPLEPHTSQNRYAKLGVETFLLEHFYRQVFIGCYAEKNSQQLVGWLVSDAEHRPLSVTRELPAWANLNPNPDPSLERFQLPVERNAFVRPLSPTDLPAPALLLGYREQGDLGDVELFLRLYGKDILYDSGRKCYYFFVGHIWRPDETKASAIQELLGRLKYCWLVAALRTVDLDEATLFLKHASSLRILALNRIEGQVRCRLSRADVAWNALAGHLPFKNGIVNMTTGQLEPGQPNHWFNLEAPVEWTGLETACPNFEKAYLQCFGDNEQVFLFFQRLLGYTMSGDGNEDVLAFLTGNLGRSGKSTLLEVLTLTFGPDLVRQVSADVLMCAKTAQAGAAQPHLVDLDGVRFAVIEEGSQTGSLNVTQAKWLSGTKGSIRVRGLHQGYRYVRALFTIFCFQNDYPKCPPHAEALWRRILNLNMPYQHVPAESLTNPNTQRPIDPQLMQKLTSELSGIAAWVVRGYQLYLQRRLSPPDDVFKSTQAFRTAVDSLSEWLRACCEQGAELLTEAEELFVSYKEFTGDNSMSKIAFNKALEQHGFSKTWSERRVTYRGIALLSQ